jgi:tetratricopeptide (TPR) repeat protein
MKLLFLLFIILVIGAVVYRFTSKKFISKQQQSFNWKPFGISTVVVLLFLGLLVYGMYQSSTAKDTQCTVIHEVTSKPPVQLNSAKDYFDLGNYNYDKGHCSDAISNYTKTIELNPTFAQAYNNRAYTYMRMSNYKDALPDLDKAIELNPNYVQALMNRGDIHNYYYEINRQAAIQDYEKVIMITGSNRENTSVCGHLFLAKHNGWHIATIFGLLSGEIATCN